MILLQASQDNLDINAAVAQGYSARRISKLGYWFRASVRLFSQSHRSDTVLWIVGVQRSVIGRFEPDYLVLTGRVSWANN